jgi:hypothetical protein
MVADGIRPAAGPARDAARHGQVGFRRGAGYRGAAFPEAPGDGDLLAFILFLLGIAFGAALFLLGLTGSTLGGVFLVAFAVEPNANEVTAVFDSRDKVSVQCPHDQLERVALPAALEVGASTLL